MQFRTELALNHSDHHISHLDDILLIGSCFSDSLGEKLRSQKFKVEINPFGTLYDPISIFRILSFGVENQGNQYQILERGEAWYAFEAHSEVTASSQEELKSILKDKTQYVNYQLSKVKYLFITLGSAFVYKLIESQLIVANCHKEPIKSFEKILLEPEIIIDAFQKFHDQLFAFNPDIKVVFTLSPVRHIKDGIENNQISKSILRYCISRFCTLKHIYYFPAYELVVDDLRDYRFYKEDLIHPNDMAINYIWEKFADKYFNPETKEHLKSWNKIKQNLDHRPFNPGSEAHKIHLANTFEQLTNLSQFLDVRNEIQLLKLLTK